MWKLADLLLTMCCQARCATAESCRTGCDRNAACLHPIRGHVRPGAPQEAQLAGSGGLPASSPVSRQELVMNFAGRASAKHLLNKLQGAWGWGCVAMAHIYMLLASGCTGHLDSKSQLKRIALTCSSIYRRCAPQNQHALVHICELCCRSKVEDSACDRHNEITLKCHFGSRKQARLRSQHLITPDHAPS